MKSRILVVEDDIHYAENLLGALTDEGYSTEHRGDGREALEVLGRESFDLAFVDLELPGVNGLELIEMAHQTHPELPLVMITGHASIDNAVKAIQKGAFDFIEKPVSLDRLLITAANALEKHRLMVEARWQREEYWERFKMIGSSAAMQTVYSYIEKAAPTTANVLINGETGTGKELCARALHMCSDRAKAPFIKLNCAAIPDTLIESELFGHKRGAFTGAYADKPGRFQLADQGTLFLDEIGDMSLQAQAKILRAMETNEIEAIGDTQTKLVDVRVIAATNHNLEQAVQEGNIRQDLYYRLNEISITLPPLRGRKEDIPDLVDHFLRQACDTNNRYISGISNGALRLLQQQEWPGNIRQLASLVSKLVIFCDEEEITAAYVAEHLDIPAGNVADVLNYHISMMNYERQLLSTALQKTDWNIGAAADLLGLERTNLHKKIKKHQLSRV